MKKGKRTLIDGFIRLTGYRRKFAVRVVNTRPVKVVAVCTDGKPLKLKPEKKRPANHKGKQVYTDEVIASMVLIWTLFWCKRGRRFRSRGI
jgi:hypothetical protein